MFTHAWHIFQQGGFVMYPLMLALLISGMIAIERYSYFKKTRREINDVGQLVDSHIGRGDWIGLVCSFQASDHSMGTALSRVVSYIDCRHSLEGRLEDVVGVTSSNLKKGLDWLNMIVTMAPLLGLLGTVLGMIRSFQVLGTDTGTPLAITGGVGEALVATATGLCIAVIALIIHSWYAHQLNHLVTIMEHNFGHVLDLYDRRHSNEEATCSN